MTGKGLLLAAALFALGTPAGAQTYPTRPVRIIVPFAAGATLDLMTRHVAEQMSAGLGQQVIVENRAGASGIIGADATAKAPADGYTVMMAPFSVLAVNESLHQNLPYRVARDFTPVGQAAVAPHVLIASAKSPHADLGALLEHARAHPGEVPYASAGAGSSAHLATEVLLHMAGVRMTHVPYKGTAPAYSDLVPGRVAVMIDGIGSALPHMRGGQVVALGVTSAERVPVIGDVPTLAEAGVPGYDVTPWYGMVAPRDTPPEVIARLNAALNQAIDSATVRARFADMGLYPKGGSPAEFGALLESERKRWAEVVQAAGIEVN